MRSLPLLLVVLLAWPAHAADQCGTLAARIAERSGMVVSPRVPANFIPMTQPDGDYGARLICNGSMGITFHAMSPPIPPDSWFRFAAQAASALTGDPPNVLYALLKNCAQQAKQTSDGYADMRSGSPPVVCSLDGPNLEVFVAHR